MQQEIEAKFLRQDHAVIRQKLQALGAVCKVPMKLVRRTVLDFPDRRLKNEGAWIRLREELDGSVELMMKKVASDDLGQTFEQPVLVGDYQAAKEFLVAIGLDIKAEEESKRELWQMGNVEIMLDEWPWVPTYIEIEAPTEDAVKSFTEQLGLSWSDARFGSVTSVYQDTYGITRDEFTMLELTIKFDDPIPSALLKKSQ